MSWGILAVGAVFVTAPVAAQAPATFTNTNVELRSDLAPSAALDQASKGRSIAWVGWSVPAVPKAQDVCCFTNSVKGRGCSLSERETSWGTGDDGRHGTSSDIYVFVEMKRGTAERVKVLSPTCPLDGGGLSLVWLGAVEPDKSLDVLAKILDASAGAERVEDAALVAVAFHRDARADAMIEKRALDRSLSVDSRQKAVFWAGQARGEAGFRLLDRILTSEPSEELRKHAVFALSQSPVPEAPGRIKRVAVEDRDPEVRSHALFSLSQAHAEGTGAWIVGRLAEEPNDHVREQAVFALSQLDDGTDWLLRVVRSKRDPETTRRALFWLGQSNDPRALEEIEKILDR